MRMYVAPIEVHRSHLSNARELAEQVAAVVS
jgi:hypothetical protein